MSRYHYDPSDKGPDAATVALIVLIGLALFSFFIAAMR